METMCEKRKRNPVKWFFRFLGFGILGAIGIAVFGFLFGYFVMLLWNWLMPMLFHLDTITFWPAVGIVILAKMLFGGFGHHGHHRDYARDHYRRSRFRTRHGGDWNKWKYYGEYWKEQGEQHFNEYMKKKEEGGEPVAGDR